MLTQGSVESCLLPDLGARLFGSPPRRGGHGEQSEVVDEDERHQFLNGDVDLFILHLRGEMDDQRQTGRIGITWRFPGGIDGIAVGVTLDEVHTKLRRISSGRSSALGMIEEVTAQWLMYNLPHLDAGMSGATETITETGVLSHEELSGGIGIGVGF